VIQGRTAAWGPGARRPRVARARRPRAARAAGLIKVVAREQQHCCHDEGYGECRECRECRQATHVSSFPEATAAESHREAVPPVGPARTRRRPVLTLPNSADCRGKSTKFYTSRGLVRRVRFLRCGGEDLGRDLGAGAPATKTRAQD